MEEKLRNSVAGEGGMKIFEPMNDKYKLTFKEIGGLQVLKKQANIKIIQPFKNPELLKSSKNLQVVEYCFMEPLDAEKVILHVASPESAELLFTT